MSQISNHIRSPSAHNTSTESDSLSETIKGANDLSNSTNFSNSSSNRLNVPESHQAMDQFETQSANEVGVNLKNDYNLTSREASDLGKG